MTDYAVLQPSRGPSLSQPVTDAVRRSLTRNSYYSHAPSINPTTRSWVDPQQDTLGPPPPPPPLPIPLPTPVQPLRPLPNPHVRRHPAPLHAVNPSEPLDPEDNREWMDSRPENVYKKAGPSKLRKPGASVPKPVNNSKDKKRTAIGGFVKNITRIPKMVFGYSASKGTLGVHGEGTSTTLPQYVSNPPTPIVAPIPSHPHHYNHQSMGIQMPISSRSPPPEVVRLDDVRRRRPDFRIMPPSVNIARSETAHFFPGTTESSSSAANTAERTTVMLYSHDRSTLTPTPTPTPSLSRQISSSGLTGRLSYVGSEQPARPTSSHGGSHVPPMEIPSSITRLGTPSSYLSYVSQGTTAPLHIGRSSSQLRSQLPNPSQSQSQSQSHQQPTSPPPPPQDQPLPTPPPIVELSEPIQSPVSAHPEPTDDYLKMAVSPPHSLQHHTTNLTHLTSNTDPCSSSKLTSFSYEPSFSHTSNIVERFFKTLYHMPWIAYERITVDYLPGKVRRPHGHALGREMSGRVINERRRRSGGDRRRRETNDRDRRRKKEGRRRIHSGRDGKLVSWYKDVPSRSRRAGAELDLLSSELGSRSSPTTSLGAATGLGLENISVDAASPRLAAITAAAAAVKVEKIAEREQERGQREPMEDTGDKQERTSHSHRHRHRQDSHNQRRGRQIGSTRNRDRQEQSWDADENLRRSPSPLIPTVYPFHYPPYPYTLPYTAFTMPPAPSDPYVHSHSQNHPLSLLSETSASQTRTSKTSRGPRSATRQGQPSSHPFLYSPGIPHPGYAAAAYAYQPMLAPSTTAMMAPQVYMLHSTSHGQPQAQMQTQPLSTSDRVESGIGAAVSGPEVLASGTGAVESG